MCADWLKVSYHDVQIYFEIIFYLLTILKLENEDYYRAERDYVRQGQNPRTFKLNVSTYMYTFIHLCRDMFFISAPDWTDEQVF